MAVHASTLSLGGSGESVSYLEKGKWQASLAYRWLHSDRHFIQDSEQRHRQKEGSEVINDVHTFDLTATYGVTKRLSLSLTLPFVSATRSSLYEHDRTNRHTMKASGLADVRLVGNYWLFNPDTYTNGNIALGIGVEIPSGEYKATDVRHRATGKEIAYVDNSIQPGDGGWGVILELQGFQKLFDRTFLYGSATYVLTPENTNSIGNSIWDSYLARLGVAYAIWPSKGISLSLGARGEGVPTFDAIGDSEGRRRPGYAISVEPGITWSRQRFSWTVTAPVAVYRFRTDNFQGRSGDAAFADFLIQSSIIYRF